ncbi:MAG: hypothetical protein KKD39_08410, partial [Candidatus Altiarchaeota archaeon]|nr:hypothetical protein [Candidatus Altiarchaeota archaeon]
MFREAKSIARHCLFEKVVLVGLWEKGLKKEETLYPGVELVRIPTITSKLGKNRIVRVAVMIEWQIRIFSRYIRENVLLITPRNLASLPVGVGFKLVKKCKLLYETQEMETHRVGWPKFLRYTAKIIEIILIKNADMVFTVNDYIGDWYRREYALRNLQVIESYPELRVIKKTHVEPLKKAFNIKKDEILFLYQGIIGEGRGIEILLEVFSQINKHIHVVFMGFGSLEKLVKEYEKINTNIHF